MVGICVVVLWCIVVGVGNRVVVVVGVVVGSYVGRVLGLGLVGMIVGVRCSVGCIGVVGQLGVHCLIGSWGR